MSENEAEALRAWEHLAPPTFDKIASFESRPATERKAILEGWVAWLNSTGAADSSTHAFRDRLTRLLDDFDRDQKGRIDSAALEGWLAGWLETAGEVGGPESDQDPMHQHPKRWHGNPEAAPSDTDV